MRQRADGFRLPDGTEVAVVERAGDALRDPLVVELSLPPLTPAGARCLHPGHVVELTVLGGFLEVEVDGEWSVLGTGETVVVPAGTAHSQRNQAREPARVRAVHRPAGGYQEYVDRLGRLAVEGRLGTLALARLRREHADSVRLAGARARLASGAAAGLARLAGVRVPPAGG